MWLSLLTWLTCLERCYLGWFVAVADDADSPLVPVMVPTMMLMLILFELLIFVLRRLCFRICCVCEKSGSQYITICVHIFGYSYAHLDYTWHFGATWATPRSGGHPRKLQAAKTQRVKGVTAVCQAKRMSQIGFGKRWMHQIMLWNRTVVTCDLQLGNLMQNSSELDFQP